MNKDWERIEGYGPGHFVTHEVWRAADGAVLELESRRRRKQSPRLNRRGRTGARGRPAVYWAPWRLTWWIGALFMIGSACFAVPSVSAFATVASGTTASIVYFVGSLFFTSAGYLSFFESINAGREPGPDAPEQAAPRLVPLGWQPQRIDYWATLVQFVGTLAFNVTTFRALDVALSGRPYDLSVWRPDAYGSTCFLIASYLACAEIGHSFWRMPVRRLSWWIAAANMAGSLAFGASALGAWELSSGDMLFATLARLGTLAGAVCFFAGAFLLLPESAHLDAPAPGPPPP